ncbi:MAG: ABC transporter ATP-binding protein [Anaerolineae bacterium]|nr:ABC transporter ATP-binding protein [Anaerolineae bacterium]
MIKVEHLTKRYGTFTAVDDLSFEARHGEILGFLGPNGAGKTTTMRILTGFMPPTGGHATVAGYDVFTESMQVRHLVGYMPETVPLYPDMSVRGYLEFMAELRRIPNRRARVREALARVDMLDRAESLVRNLSKGLRQRVGLAQAIIHDPPVLILDEPTIGLDPRQVLAVRSLVRELGKDHTVMFSTHILSEAEQICDRVLIIHQGRAIAAGPPQTLRDELQKSGRVFVRIGGASTDAEELVALLERVPSVARVEAMDTGFAVTAWGGKDIRPAIARAVTEAGRPLLELRPLAMTLEDIFLEVTQVDDVEAGGA